MNAKQPTKGDCEDVFTKRRYRFTWGLCTVGNVGRDPFGACTAERAAARKAHTFDRLANSAKGRAYERLDQLTIELLLGTR